MQRTELFSAFESLGNNCELGFVQDAAGCNLLSLFKAVGFDRTEQLIEALDAGLAGMFEPGTYEFVLPDDWPDYALDCRRFGFRFHTGLSRANRDAERHFDALLAAFRWLRDKLLQDLRDGEKIFTYRHQIQFNEDLAGRLAASIRRHGPGWLLWVRMDERPDRCFAWVEPTDVEGLLLGGMPHLVTDSPPRVAYDAWEQIARQALRLRHGEAVPPPPVGVAQRVVSGTGGEELGTAVPTTPGADLLVHTWVWLSEDFAASGVEITADGATVRPGQSPDMARHVCWQPVWLPLKVAPDRQRIVLRVQAPGHRRGTVYVSGWTVRRTGAHL